MISLNVWISTFIEHCLLSYETGRREPDLNWEDDGSNLRFSTSTQQYAQINSWPDPAVRAVNVTDLDTQIEARLSRQSLQYYENKFANKRLTKDSCRGYHIHLEDFELVYEYSTAKPKVHFYVKRFSIAWERGRVKGPPAGKSVPKKPTLVKLINRILSSVRKRSPPTREAYTTTSSDEGNGQADVPTTQVVSDNPIQPSQLQLLSQAPPPTRTRSISPDTRYDAAATDQLLEHLKTQRAIDIRQSRRHESVTTHLPDAIFTNEVRNGSASRISTSDNENLRLGEPPSRKPATEHTEGQPSGIVNSRLLASETDEARTAIEASNVETGLPPSKQPSPKEGGERAGSPDTPDKQLNDQLDASQHVTARSVIIDQTENSDIVGPWEGMTEIRRVDVTVPKDQGDILQRNPWYPPPVGQPVISVPPALLQEWNELILRWHEKPVDDRLTPMENAHLSEPGTPARESTTSHEDGDEYEWSQSPPRTPNRGVLSRKSPLPADTPKGGPSHPRKPQRAGPSKPEARTQFSDDEKRKEKEISPVTHDLQVPISEEESRNAQKTTAAFQNGQANVTAVVEADVPKASPASREGDPKTVNEANGGSIDSDRLRDGDTRQHDNKRSVSSASESDSDSSDSEMEITVPQPLSGSTQEMSSQAEAVPSSAVSLPEVAGQRVQVVETPAAALSKSHSALLNQNAYLANAENQSPPDKSSSQSRILNTYPSNEGDSKGETSQESSRSVAATAPGNLDNIHVMGTPLDSQDQQTQPTPWSHSHSLFTSSEPRAVEASIPAPTHHSQSSKAFSSYRDLPSSSLISMVNPPSPSVQSLAQNTPLNINRASPLKRFASEAADSDRGSPLKRIKIDCMETAFESEKLDNTDNTRPRNAVINSAQHVEAVRMYEKFRGDYKAYTGDFEHFAKLCSRLQGVRAGGSLQRSFLWDDFVIQHIENYPRYIKDCIQAGTQPLEYEQYFLSTFSKPTYKSRVLHAEAISDCAAQVIAIDYDEPRAPLPTADTKVSFTASLRDQLANFHTHSFVATQGPSQDEQSEADWDETLSHYSIPDSEPARAAARGDDNEDLDLDQRVRSSDVHTDWMSTDEDEDEDMEDVDVDDTIHETASVELGEEDDQPEPTKEPSRAPAEQIPESSAAGNDAGVTRVPFLAPGSAAQAPVESVSEFESEGKYVKGQTKPSRTVIAHPTLAYSNPKASTTATDKVAVPVPAAVVGLGSESETESTSDSEIESESESGEEEDNDENEEPAVQSQHSTSTTAPPKILPSKPISAADQTSNAIKSKPHKPETESITSSKEEEGKESAAQFQHNISTTTTTSPEMPYPTRISATYNAFKARKSGTHRPELEAEAEAEDEATQSHSRGEREEEDDEEDDGNENWFSSLRHITSYFTSTSTSTSTEDWPNSPNTPFKVWASRDLDVLRVRTQRGGIRIVDQETREIRPIPPALPRPASRLPSSERSPERGE